MASLQETLISKTIAARRAVYDNNIRVTGEETELVRVKVTKNMYQDIEQEIISNDTITGVINIPGGIPLSRYRTDVIDNVADTKTGIFLYDILPVELYVKWTDSVEKDDILAQTFLDENGFTTRIIWVVVEVVGEIKTELLTKKYHIAPYDAGLTDEINVLLDNLYSQSD